MPPILCPNRLPHPVRVEALHGARRDAASRGAHEHLLWALGRLEGAFSLLFLIPGAVIAARDRHGWRPLWLGRLADGGYVLASETCALALVGAAAVSPDAQAQREVLTRSRSPYGLYRVTRVEIDGVR